MLMPAAHAVTAPVPYGLFLFVPRIVQDPITGGGFMVASGGGFAVAQPPQAFLLDTTRGGWDIFKQTPAGIVESTRVGLAFDGVRNGFLIDDA